MKGKGAVILKGDGVPEQRLPETEALCQELERLDHESARVMLEITRSRETTQK